MASVLKRNCPKVFVEDCTYTHRRYNDKDVITFVVEPDFQVNIWTGERAIYVTSFKKKSDAFRSATRLSDRLFLYYLYAAVKKTKKGYAYA